MCDLFCLSKGCGGKLTGSNGTVTSPNYPGNYPTDVTCVWMIQVKAPKVIELEFKSFDVEHSKKCKYDSLEILDGSTVGFASTYHSIAFAIRIQQQY